MTGARRVALFASGLQRSDTPDAETAAEAIKATRQRLGIEGCVSRMAQEFGDHPEAAVERMRWICQLTADMPGRAAHRRCLLSPPPAAQPGHGLTPRPRSTERQLR